MIFYLFKDDVESGPYNWTQIFILVRKHDLEESAPVRLANQTEWKSIKEWGFWEEGQTIGSLDWDDIQELLSAGVIDESVFAQFDDSPHGEVPLRDLVKPEIWGKRKQSENLFAEPFRILSAFWQNLSTGARLGVTCGLLTLFALLAFSIAAFFNGLSGGTTGLKAGMEPSKSKPAEAYSSKNNEAEFLNENVTETTDSKNSIQAEFKPQVPVTDESMNVLPEAENRSPNFNVSIDNTLKEIPVRESPPDAQNSAVASREADLPNHQDDLVVKAVPAEPNASTLPHNGESTNSQPPTPLSLPTTKNAKESTVQASSTPVPPSSTLSARNPPQTQSTPAIQKVSVGDFFKIEGIRFYKKPPKDGVGVWSDAKVDQIPVIPSVFLPCLEVKVRVDQAVRTDRIVARAHFYNGAGKLIETIKSPSKSGANGSGSKHSLPVLFDPTKPENNRFFFVVPEKLASENWKAVVVFGDKQEMQALAYPATASTFLLDYPEKEMVDNKTGTRIARKAALDPLIEHVVKTKNPKMPQMTLFFRPPRNATDSSEIRGVMALCLLAGSLDEIRRELQKEEMTGDNKGVLGFADKNKLAILAWGANTSLWARANYDQLDRKQAREYESSFSIVANAWERGVLELGEKYGMPTKGFLIQGQCGSAHLAKALCLAKPEYFLAIHIHIPGYFEAPTPEASRVLWCITTGELYYSYDYSLRFLADSKKLGYPIVYKAFVGLGHSGHPDATALGLEFFKFALTQQPFIEEYDKMKSSAIDSSRLAQGEQSGPLLQSFKSPPFYADVINQEIFPADQVEMIPEGFRIPIPTKEIGAIWKRNP